MLPDPAAAELLRAAELQCLEPMPAWQHAALPTTEASGSCIDPMSSDVSGPASLLSTVCSSGVLCCSSSGMLCCGRSCELCWGTRECDMLSCGVR
jgi:hypothetical protein